MALRGILLFAVAARLAHAQGIPRASHRLDRGRTLTTADIAADSGDLRARSLVGWVTRRAIRAREPLRPPAVAPPPLVHAGEVVSVEFVADGITVARRGTALIAGTLGDRVRVRFDDDRSLDAVVAGPSMVHVP